MHLHTNANSELNLCQWLYLVVHRQQPLQGYHANQSMGMCSRERIPQIAAVYKYHYILKQCQ